eukprot:scaffold94_cov254-Pinguiococcus_pyrenoidosus.AAC.15
MPACDDIRRRGGQSHVVLSWESAEFAADPVAEPFFARLSERRLRSWERRTGEEMNHERRQAGLSTAVQPVICALRSCPPQSTLCALVVLREKVDVRRSV